MAIVKILPIKSRVDNALNYITNEDKTLKDEYEYMKNDIYYALNYIEKDYKTNDKQYVTGINCEPEKAFEQMQDVKQKYNKTDKILAYHVIHSYKPGELTPEKAHRVGVEFATEMFGDRFQVVVSTHLDKDHLHNHIILNSVSFKDGKKYYNNHESVALMRHTSNKICEFHDLSFFEEKRGRKINYENYYQKYINRELTDLEKTVKNDIDSIIDKSYTFDDFKKKIKNYNYDVYSKNGRITVRDNYTNKEYKITRLFGEDYNCRRINERIYESYGLQNRSIKKQKITSYRHDFNKHYTKVPETALELLIVIIKMIVLGREVQTGRENPKYMSPELRNEISKLQDYSSQITLLDRYKIKSMDDLYKVKGDKELEIYHTFRSREKVYKKKKEMDPEEYQKEIEAYNKAIAEAREQVRLLNGFVERFIEDKKLLAEYERTKKQRQLEELEKNKLKQRKTLNR